MFPGHGQNLWELDFRPSFETALVSSFHLQNGVINPILNPNEDPQEALLVQRARIDSQTTRPDNDYGGQSSSVEDREGP
jgi:hypothetical protein